MNSRTITAILLGAFLVLEAWFFPNGDLDTLLVILSGLGVIGIGIWEYRANRQPTIMQ